MNSFFGLEFKLQILKIVLPAKHVKENRKKEASNCVELNMFLQNVMSLYFQMHFLVMQL